MDYYLFLDESGDHGLANIDQNFPVFVLCGVLISEESYNQVKDRINAIKHKLWNNKTVIFHSRNIRKCEKEFQILFDLELKKQFYDELNRIMSGSNYQAILSAIQKESFIKKYGKLSNDVYEVALSFIIERTIFALDDKRNADNLKIVIERRGKKEDNKLKEHFQKLEGKGDLLH